MRLNGWLRLWLVASGIWLLIVLPLAYFDISALLESKEWEVSKDGLGSATFVFPKSDAEEYIRRYINEELIPLITKEPANYIGKKITKPYDRHIKEKLWPRIGLHAAIAMLPILAALLFGWAVLWVKRGFKEPRA